MVGLFANIGQSFGYSARNTFCRPLFWLGLIIVAIIAGLCMVGSVIFLAKGMWYLSVILWIITAILALFCFGLVVKIYGNQPLTFRHFFGSVGRGFQYVIISIIYGIIVGIIGAICTALGVFGTAPEAVNALVLQMQSGNFSNLSFDTIMNLTTTTLFPNGVTALGVVMLIIYILVSLFLFILWIAALVNFARAGKFGAAFHFREIFRRIGLLGVFKFILAIIIYIILMAVIMFLFGLIGGLILMIPVPVLSTILAIIFVALVGPFIGVFGIKYYSNLFAD